MTLADTIKGMQSPDYKERFVAEYQQLKIRYERLREMVIKYEAGTLSFQPDCPLGLLNNQLRAMGNYLRCLEVRAQIEKIVLK